MKERGFSCQKCHTSITVAGPDSKVAAALRRVDWEYESGRVTCRNCLPSRAACEHFWLNDAGQYRPCGRPATQSILACTGHVIDVCDSCARS